MEKEQILEQILLKYRNFIVILLLVVSVSIAVRIPVYASENEEIEQLEMERQRALEMIEGLKSSISSVQKDIDNLTIEKNDIQSYIKSLDGQINILTNEIADFERKIEEKIADIEETRISLEQQERLLNEIEEEIAKAANPDQYKGAITGFIWPCPDYNRISSYFGPRPQPVPGASTNHKGIDLTAPYGTAILASASGIVTTAAHSNSAGNYIVIAHGNGMSTVYMHCSSLLVSVGDNVEQGEVIAKVGSTGYSSGNHLHFGIIKNGTYVDPLGYVSD